MPRRGSARASRGDAGGEAAEPLAAVERDEVRARSPAAGVREIIDKSNTAEDLYLAVARLADALPGPATAS